MVKLVGLVEEVAQALRVPTPRVRTAAAHLRRHKLLNTGPRGPGAPEMAASDAVNLLLALMYDDELASSHIHVARLRAAEFTLGWERLAGGEWKHLDEVPSLIFTRGGDDQPLKLGQVLDTILDLAVRRENLFVMRDECKRAVWSSTWAFSVSSSLYHCKLRGLGTSEIECNLDYRWRSEDEVDFDRRRLAGGFPQAHPFFRELDVGMVTTREVGSLDFSAIADILRGQARNETDICHPEPEST